jgi:signal peptidase I
LTMELVAAESPDKSAGATSRQPDPRRRAYLGLGGRIIRQIAALVLVAGLAYGCFQFCERFIVQSVQVVGSSMSPTMPDSSRYLLNRLIYYFREPQPEDIVVLRDPQDNGYAVKRIVARPGDSVYVKGGQILVNGKLLKEPYLESGTQTYASQKYRAQLWICGAHQYFVLGDNRNNSVDSRIYGAVPEQNILGLVTP